MSKINKSVPRLVVVGSVGLDTVETPYARREDVLGGSSSYACVAASYFAPTGMVGVVGTDFPKSFRRAFDRRVDTEGLQTVKGQTFRWSGVYEENMDQRRTLSTHLNVFADFEPRLPTRYRRAPFLFLANISPSLQLHVLEQMRRPRFVLADTMDLWINTARDALLKVIARVDMLTLNESEARHLTGCHNLMFAAKALLRRGPSYVLIKKGEHGSMLFSKESVFLLPAYPLEAFADPTGAGDTFAGGFMGCLAAQPRVTDRAIRRAMGYGTVMASFEVERFSLDGLLRLTPERIEARVAAFRAMCTV